jgi:hypothetical protein
MLNLSKENWLWFFGINEFEYRGGENKMNKLLKSILWFAVLAVLLMICIYIINFDFRIMSHATATCPSGSGWIKVEPLSGKTYTYTPAPSCTVSDNCYKHSVYVHYGTGKTVTADWHSGHQYDLSHASFKVSCVTPTNTPTPTRTPTPTSTPTPTIVDDCIGDCIEMTPTPSVRPTEKPEEPKKCQGESYTGDFCGWSPPVSPQESYSPSVCTVAKPKPASNPQYHKGEGVKITWEHDGTNIDKWSLNYGYDRHNMFMGIPYLQKEAREVTIFGLQNKTTWVSICGFNGNDCEACVVFDP